MAIKPMSSVAALGGVGVFALIMLMLMSLGSMSDSRTGDLGRQVHMELHRSLDDDPKSTKMTVKMSGAGEDAARTYTVRLKPSVAVAANAKAVARLLARAADIANSNLGKLTGQVTLRCVAQLDGGKTLEQSWRRVTSESGTRLVPLNKPAVLPAGGSDQKK
jgi:hypothetical protein